MISIFSTQEIYQEFANVTTLSGALSAAYQAIASWGIGAPS